REDPVRILRAIRFAAKLDARIEPETAAPIASLAPLLGNVPEARVFEEILKLLACGQAMDALRRLRDAGIGPDALPLVGLVFGDPALEHLTDIALSRTDARVRAGKSISPGCLFASLLWVPVRERQAQLGELGARSLESLMQA